MLYGSYHQIENLSNPKGKERFYSVVGYICETDTFGSNRKIGRSPKETYWYLETVVPIVFPWLAITIPDSALQRYYGMRESPFDSEKETFEDILHNQVEIEYFKDSAEQKA